MEIGEFISLVSSQINGSFFTKHNVSAKKSKQFLTVEEVCEILHITPPTLRSWIKKEIIFAVRLQSRVYFNSEDIYALLTTHKVKEGTKKA